MKKLIGLLLVVSFIVLGCAVPTETVEKDKFQDKIEGLEGQTVYLKGSGSNFNGSGWKNVFVVGDAPISQDSRIWHLVYTGKEYADVQYMQITFKGEGLGTTFIWTPEKGDWSTNGGGNNKGWVIYAPFGWDIDYVNKGNNNESPSFVVTKDSKNIQFNISGYNAGKNQEVFFNISVNSEYNLVQKYAEQTHKLATGSIGGGTSLTTSRDNVPSGVSGLYNTTDNELFYKVDIDALPVTLWIAQRDGHNVNASLGYYYTITVGADNRPVVTFDENITDWTDHNVNGFHYNQKPSFGSNGSRPALTKIDGISTYALDGWTSNSSAKIFELSEDDNTAGYFWFHVHLNKVKGNLLDADGNTYCIIDKNPSASGIEDYEGDWRPAITYTINGETGPFTELKAGKYTVAAFVDGEKAAEEDIEVGPDKTFTFELGEIMVPGIRQTVTYCPLKCGEWK